MGIPDGYCLLRYSGSCPLKPGERLTGMVEDKYSTHFFHDPGFVDCIIRDADPDGGPDIFTACVDIYRSSHPRSLICPT